ncbi:origin recognition complex subunit 5 C-terminus-domain-containing protein [Phyllosticta citriasiana]|uniref:Origin recognition complex subunit 5 C-terminus-domain-containing protein n=1 Tax=Phyllosticta citriasiana TaxID=595635 RepID=A0ABR1L0X7_9PEZI
MLPEELLFTSLSERYPCRALQILQLLHLYNPPLPSPSTTVIHGLAATGKSTITREVLQSRKISHAIIHSRECITGRHLLERTLAACLDAVDDLEPDSELDRNLYTRCENISALYVQLQRLLAGRERFVLVFDGVDKQRETPPTLLPALARLGEVMPALSVILIISVPRAGSLHAACTPFIHFPSYTRDESIRIAARNPPDIFLEPPSSSKEYDDELATEDKDWLWIRHLGVVWDALAKGAATDVVSFEALARKLWDPFVAPIRDGTFGTRDLSRLLVHRRALFQSESALVESVVPSESTSASKLKSKVTHELPYYSKYLLCAAYLASFNPARQDTVYFTKASEKKRKKKGGAASVGRVPKHRKIPRNLLTPSAFPLDRLLSIFHAILPHTVAPTADIYTQIATLSSLRLLLRSGAAGADPLDGSCKWRVNYGYEFVRDLGRSVSFEMGEFLAGGE